MPDRSVTYTFKGNFAGLTAGLTTAGKNVQEFGTRLIALDKNGQRMRAGLTEIGNTGGKVGLVAAGGLAAATKAAIDWETAWTGVAKTVDGTASQMAALEGELREMARTMPATHQEIAATAEAAGQLGVATEDVAEFTRIMIELGATTDLSADQAATSIAQLMNVMQTAPDRVDEIGNTLVELGNKGASTESQILDMAQRLAGAGKLIGASEPDVLALASAMANLGIESQLGGGAMSRTMAKIETAVKSGGDSLADFAKVAGMSSEDFAQKWEESPVEAINDFISGLGRISESGGNVIATLADLKLKGTEDRDVLLRLAGSGDMLSTSLEQSADAWQKNSALFDEFGKKAGTTASEMQVAWNNVKDAGIEIGATMLPILSEAADVVTGLSDAFQSLPGPIKTATAGALGITAVLGGGLWFTSKVVNGIVSTRQALADLGAGSSKTATMLGRLGRTAVPIAAATTALAALNGALSESASIDASKLNRDLEAFADGRITEGMEKFFVAFHNARGGTGAAFKAFGQDLTSVMGLLGDASWEVSAKNIDAVDQALASMVEGGQVDEARALFASLKEEVGDGTSLKYFNEQLDDYNVALKNAAAQSADTADATNEMGDAYSATASQIELSEEQLKALQKSASDTAAQFIGLGASLNDSKVSLGDWITELEKQNQALRDFTKNAREAAQKGLDEGLIQSLQEAGPEGALRLGQLADASESEIKRANKAWRQGEEATAAYAQTVEDVARGLAELPPQVATQITTNAPETAEEVAALAEQYNLTPKQIKTILNLLGINATMSDIKKAQQALRETNGMHANPSISVGGLGAALQGVRALKAELAGLGNPKVGTPQPKGTGPLFGGTNPADGGTIPWGGGAARAAFGSTVPKDGGPYADRYPYLLAPGEEVISNRFGQADRNRPLLKAINAGFLASGGTAGKSGKPNKNGGAFLVAPGWGAFADLDQIPKSLKGLVKSLEDSKKALEDELSARKSVAESLASSITGRFSSDLLGTSDIWAPGGTLEDASAALRGDIAGSLAYQSDVATLRNLGLTGGALDALLSDRNATPEVIANIAATASAESVAEFQRLFQQRIEVNAATAAAAQMAAGYTQSINALQLKVDQTNALLEAANRILDATPSKSGAAAGKAAAQENNKGAGKGARSRVRSGLTPS